ncbi:hypothetical protein DACRYDRAFT_117240 [Dacryopinax primogenitus]|uniref:PWWP domain-containing protein n=1 Tax=Dacryopinax primogenitus (strain DJM 731) TaxID=1858805 RepID=M5FS53_DACPD|nr:uncharacterized protein DACRYDRAFT_117240 [Dacryopinax primogenitus]EJU00156.1 hypothetical protein DACRYDRAFT_117240 [Dacryopinax primogenitus]
MLDSSSLSSLSPSPEPTPSSLMLGPRASLRRNAARKAADNVREQLVSSDDEDEEGSSTVYTTENVHSKPHARSFLDTSHHRVGYGKRLGPSRRRTSPAYTSQATNPPTAPSSPTAVRVHSSPTTINAPSQTTPPKTMTRDALFASSPLTPFTPSVPLTPSKRRARGRTLEESPSPTKRARLSMSQPIMSDSTRTVQLTPSKRKIMDDNWSRERLEGVVWVRLELGGRPVEGNEGPDGGYWWVAKLNCESWRTPLLLGLIGDDGHLPNRLLTLTSPSSANLLTFNDPRTMLPRFDIYTSRLPVDAHTQEDGTSKQKATKQKPNKREETRWASMMALAHALHEDDLPEIEDALIEPIKPNFDATNGSQRTLKRKERVERMLEEERSDVLQQVIDAGPDSTLEIPGELVLAQDRSTAFWPAIIHAYEPATATKGRNRFGRYRVEYMDRTFGHLKRDQFFSRDEDGFATCKLGTFTNQADDETDDEREANRPPTPTPLPPPPPNVVAALSMPIRDLLRHTRNVLQLVILSKYPPSIDRCAAFYKGGRDRKNLATFGTEMGSFEANTRAAIRKEVIRWALGTTSSGPSLGADAGLVEVSSAPSTEQETAVESQSSEEDERQGEYKQLHNAPPAAPDDNMKVGGNMKVTIQQRPRGCEAYEALSEPERLQFSIDILVPEAAMQLLAWHGGYRFSIPGPSDSSGDLSPEVIETENNLHNTLAQLALIRPASEWVNRVTSVRSSRRAALESKGVIQTEENVPEVKRLTGSFSRPNAGRKINGMWFVVWIYVYADATE